MYDFTIEEKVTVKPDYDYTAAASIPRQNYKSTPCYRGETILKLSQGMYNTNAITQSILQLPISTYQALLGKSALTTDNDLYNENPHQKRRVNWLK